MRFLKYGDVFERLIGGGALAHPALLEFNDKNAHNESFVLRRSYAAQIGNDAPIKQFLIRHTAIAEQQPVDAIGHRFKSGLQRPLVIATRIGGIIGGIYIYASTSLQTSANVG